MRNPVLRKVLNGSVARYHTLYPNPTSKEALYFRTVTEIRVFVLSCWDIEGRWAEEADHDFLTDRYANTLYREFQEEDKKEREDDIKDKERLYEFEDHELEFEPEETDVYFRFGKRGKEGNK